MGRPFLFYRKSGMRINRLLPSYRTSHSGAEGSFQCGQAKNCDHLKLVSHEWMAASTCEKFLSGNNWEVSSYTDLCTVALECSKFGSQLDSQVRSSICRPEAQFIARFVAQFGDHCAGSQISYRPHPTSLARLDAANASDTLLYNTHES